MDAYCHMEDMEQRLMIKITHTSMYWQLIISHPYIFHWPTEKNRLELGLSDLDMVWCRAPVL